MNILNKRRNLNGNGFDYLQRTKLKKQVRPLFIYGQKYFGEIPISSIYVWVSFNEIF